MIKKEIRTRFAPSPSGQIHLGNLRAALFNYIFAKKHGGKFILRIEDTDSARTLEPEIERIAQTLHDFGLKPDEGVSTGGSFGPYKQSERTDLYIKALETLEQNGKIYKCFCSKEELDQAKAAQIKKGQAPRYSKKCAGMSPEKALQKTEFGLPFVWRFRLNERQLVKFKDLCKGEMSFYLSNFSDFTITRPDGSFTFVFTNFVDDWKMEVSHVIRGEDHLTNTPLQLALYHAFMVQPPVFCHLPMLLNEKGEKLSKRDKHFSINTLVQDGFIPQAICDYLGRIGHWNDEPPKNIAAMVSEFDASDLKSAGNTKYDEGQLCWLNEEWIEELSGSELISMIAKFFPDEHKHLAELESHSNLLDLLKSEVKNLVELIELTKSLTDDGQKVDSQDLKDIFSGKDAVAINALKNVSEKLKSGPLADGLNQTLKDVSNEFDLPVKILFQAVRAICTGYTRGIGIDKLGQVIPGPKMAGKIDTAIDGL